MRWERVRAEEDREIGKVVDVCAHVGLGAAVLFPLLGERDAGLADDVHWREELGDLEAGCEDDEVEVAFFAAGAGDAGGVDGFDAFGDDVEIWVVQ